MPGSVALPVLKFCDSFDIYGRGGDAAETLLMAKRWTGVSGGGIRTGGRTGLCSTLGNFRKTLTYENAWTVGWAYKVTSLLGGNFGSGSLYSLDAVNIGHTLQSLYSVQIQPDGALSVFSGSVLGGTSNPTTLHQDVWYYFETEVALSTWSNTGGTAFVNAVGTLYLNGHAIIQSGNINSNVGVLGLLRGMSEGDSHSFNGLAVGQSFIDDVYIANFAVNTTTGQPRYFGPIKILAVYPATDVTTEWQTSSGTVHYSLINDTTTASATSPNESTYIYSTDTVSGTDEWIFQPISTFVGTICGIQYSLYAKKDDFGVRTVQFKFGSATGSTSGTDVGFMPTILSDDYFYHHVPLDQNPDDKTTWTPTSFNTHTFGVILQTNTLISGV